jgi:hypothetical protein
MSNTGFISSSGIVQIFTSGPFNGSEVTSSFSFGSTLFGGVIDTFQPFISGVIEELIPCPTTTFINGVTYFERYYFDPIECPPPGFCPPPTLISAIRNGCDPLIQTNYIVNFTSGSTTSPNTILEYSVFDNFSITGSTILTNPITSSINVLIGGFAPQATSPVYFRAYNSCSVSSTSSYSNSVVANNCVFIITPYDEFKLTFINSSSKASQINDGVNPPLTLLAGQSISYIINDEFSSFTLKVAAGRTCSNIGGSGINLSLTTPTPDIDGLVTTAINSLLDQTNCSGPGDYFQTEFYEVLPNNNPTKYPLHHPTSNLTTQIPTNIFIDKSLYSSEGEIIIGIWELDSQGNTQEI